VLDHEALTRTMQRLAEHPDLRDTLGRRARVYIYEHHSLGAAAAAYMAFAERLLSTDVYRSQ
jgi:glycosyltransferase involved in cell wall biosynthesis